MLTNSPALVAFDLDDTLAPSKSPMPQAVLNHFVALLERRPVCIISGGQYAQFRSQVLDLLPMSSTPFLRHLHLMPTCGTQYWRFDSGAWAQRYAENLSEEERHKALTVVEEEARRLTLWQTETWGPILEDRGSQITYSALGQDAPVDDKKAWDANGRKKEALRSAVAERLPTLEVRSGGSTSVDITRRGIDKAYGMRKLAEITGISPERMLFVGDRLDEGGNDFPVIATGVMTRAVTDWSDTIEVIAKLLPTLTD